MARRSIFQRKIEIKLSKEMMGNLKSSLTWIMITLAVSLVFTTIVAVAEIGNNPSFQSITDVYWWWIVTISSVGYGDVIPVTIPGKIAASFVILSSMVFFAIVITEVSNLLKMFAGRKSQGTIKVNHEGHIVIFNYNSLTNGIVKEIRRWLGEDIRIVLATDDIEKHPFADDPHFDFIKINPLAEKAIEYTNASKAQMAFILNNEFFADPETRSLMLAHEIEELSSSVITIVELISSDSHDRFRDRQIDHFITRKEFLEEFIEPQEAGKLAKILQESFVF